MSSSQIWGLFSCFLFLFSLLYSFFLIDSYFFVSTFLNRICLFFLQSSLLLFATLFLSHRPYTQQREEQKKEREEEPGCFPVFCFLVWFVFFSRLSFWSDVLLSSKPKQAEQLSLEFSHPDSALFATLQGSPLPPSLSSSPRPFLFLAPHLVSLNARVRASHLTQKAEGMLCCIVNVCVCVCAVVFRFFLSHPIRSLASCSMFVSAWWKVVCAQTTRKKSVLSFSLVLFFVLFFVSYSCFIQPSSSSGVCSNQI